MRTALLSFVLALSCFLSGFGLVIPEEWAKTDPEFDITIDSRKQDPGFLIPWGEKGNTPSIVPIPDDNGSNTVQPFLNPEIRFFGICTSFRRALLP